MKKALALFLCVLMLSASFTAFAQEPPFEPKWVEVDETFEFMVPGNWEKEELDEAYIEDTGIFYMTFSPDESMGLMLGWFELDADVTMEELKSIYAEDYPDTELAVFNDIEFLGYTDPENDALIVLFLDPVDPGFYVLTLLPSSSPTIQEIAAWVISSITLLEK